MSALASGFYSGRGGCCRIRRRSGCCHHVFRMGAESSNRIEQRTTVADDGDAKVLQVLGRQVRQDLFGYFVLAECCLILPEAQAPQPDHNVHDGAPLNHGWSPSSAGPPRVSRTDWIENVSEVHLEGAFLSVCAPVDHSKEPRFGLLCLAWVTRAA